jgi:hypothetical protein
MATYTPQNILLTGGAGFIASHVVELLVQQYPQYQVRAVVLHAAPSAMTARASHSSSDRRSHRASHAIECGPAAPRHQACGWHAATERRRVLSLRLRNVRLAALDSRLVLQTSSAFRPPAASQRSGPSGQAVGALWGLGSCTRRKWECNERGCSTHPATW